MSAIFPDWLDSFYPEDSVFAQAYDSVPDSRRALLKTAIARLWEWYGPQNISSAATIRSWESGFTAQDVREPVDHALIVCDAVMQSPVRLLAAVIPAVAAGVKQVGVVLLGEPDLWGSSVYTALELAGVESVFCLGRSECGRLLSDISKSGVTGVHVFLGGDDLVSGVAGHIRTFSLPVEVSAVMFDEEGLLDFDAMSFANPGMEYSVYGRTALGQFANCSCKNGTFMDMLTEEAHVAYVPDNRVAPVAKAFDLVLGEGYEYCWVWPELGAGSFQVRRVAWSKGA